MKEQKQRIFEALLKKEGGYVNDPNDLGGETNFGITKTTAETYGYSGRMIDLPLSKAIEIYNALYWKPLLLDEILPRSEKIAEKLFDIGVNMGIKKAATFFQRVVSLVSHKSLKIDGALGQQTLLVFFELTKLNHWEELVFKGLNSLQGARYIEISEARAENQKFLKGWLRARIT